MPCMSAGTPPSEGDQAGSRCSCSRAAAWAHWTLRWAVGATMTTGAAPIGEGEPERRQRECRLARSGRRHGQEIGACGGCEPARRRVLPGAQSDASGHGPLRQGTRFGRVPGVSHGTGRDALLTGAARATPRLQGLCTVDPPSGSTIAASPSGTRKVPCARCISPATNGRSGAPNDVAGSAQTASSVDVRRASSDLTEHEPRQPVGRHISVRPPPVGVPSDASGERTRTPWDERERRGPLSPTCHCR